MYIDIVSFPSGEDRAKNQNGEPIVRASSVQELSDAVDAVSNQPGIFLGYRTPQDEWVNYNEAEFMLEDAVKARFADYLD